MSPALTFTLILTAELLLLFRLGLNDVLAWAEARYTEDHRAHRERFSIYGAYGDVPAVPDGLRRAACSTPGEGADKAARRVGVRTGHTAHDGLGL